jgi:chorismate mutase
MLLETEKLHSKVRRYTSPEEHPFYPALLPSPILPELHYPQQVLLKGKSAIDVNSEVMRWYVEKIIDRLCVPGDDEQHGSSVLCDITALQALSRRVHYGKFVAESKFLKDPETYTKLVHDNNVTGIVDMLTNVEVERRVLRRAFVKASTYGQDITGQSDGYKVEPRLIADIYRDMIIPLTKDVEVRRRSWYH